MINQGIIGKTRVLNHFYPIFSNFTLLFIQKTNKYFLNPIGKQTFYLLYIGETEKSPKSCAKQRKINQNNTDCPAHCLI